MKSETVFKKAFNNILDYIANYPNRASLESESHLADLFKISRTTVRKVLSELDSRRLISRNKRGLTIVRRPGGDDYFPLADTVATADRVEQQAGVDLETVDGDPAEQVLVDRTGIARPPLQREEDDHADDEADDRHRHREVMAPLVGALAAEQQHRSTDQREEQQ